MSDCLDLVTEAARAAAAAAPALARASPAQLDGALVRIADRLGSEAPAILEANGADVEAGRAALSGGALDRLRLDESRLEGIAGQVRSLAALPHLERVVARWTLANGLRVEERRIPIGVVGAIYEARPNVTVDFATQLIKSRNAGVLRSGSASLRTAAAVVDAVIGPALAASGLGPDGIQLIRRGDHSCAESLVCLPRVVPLVIVRGSGATTRRLADVAASMGVRTLQHAEGGGVLYVHPRADRRMALDLIEWSLDRLGVCNRLNLLLVDRAIFGGFVPAALERLTQRGITASLPKEDVLRAEAIGLGGAVRLHELELGYEWALDPDREATVTVASVEGPEAAAAIANEETSGLAAGIVTGDDDAANAFLEAYRGTGGFRNATTRFLDGFQLTGAPETGINVDHAPGPRGPVTYRDLYLRQYVVAGDGTQPR